MNMHKVPVHLETEDKFLWNLTFRQVLILFVGGGIAYLVGTTDWSTPFALLLCLLFGGICLVATLLVAFVHIAHRDLDQWLLVALLYHSSPRLYTWTALQEDQDAKDTVAQELTAQKKEEEEW